MMDVELEWIGRHGLGVTFTVTTLNRVKDSLEECDSKLRDEGKLKHQHKAKFLTHKKVTSFCLEEEYKNELQMKCQLRKTREEVILLQNLLWIRELQYKVYHDLDSWPHHQPPPSLRASASPFNRKPSSRNSYHIRIVIHANQKQKRSCDNPQKIWIENQVWTTKDWIVWSKWGRSRGWEGGPGGWTQWNKYGVSTVVRERLKRTHDSSPLPQRLRNQVRWWVTDLLWRIHPHLAGTQTSSHAQTGRNGLAKSWKKHSNTKRRQNPCGMESCWQQTVSKRSGASVSAS